MEEINTINKITETVENDLFSRILIVRHAESVANTEGIYQGQTYDTDLSDLGIRQAKALAKRANELGIKKIISSPLKRTYQTAMEVSKMLDIPIEISNLISETNHGLWEGHTKDWIMENFAELLNNWENSPIDAVFPNGEAFTDTVARVNYFLENTMLEGNSLIVTHDNIVRILVTLSDGGALNDIWNHNIESASLNFFEVNKVNGINKLKILKLNDTSHLEGIRADLKKHAL